MKIILTETQASYLLTEETIVRLLSESRGFDEVKRKIKKALAMGVAVSVIIAAIQKMDIPGFRKSELMNLAKSEMTDTTGFAKKVKDVESYMKFALGNQGYSMKSTRLKPETLVMASMRNHFDLPFLMAAAHQESCFGATPRAQRTNSVFSVGSFDNGKDYNTYDDPNDSVEDYIDLLQRRYLVNGRNIFDLMVPGQFVNDDGKRYASDKGYEKKIKYLRDLIIKKFPDLA
jgi:hypothetical protein